MLVHSFINNTEFWKLRCFFYKVGEIAKEEKSYKCSSFRAAKTYISEEFNISRVKAKNSIIPEMDINNPDPNINCVFNIENPEKDKEIKRSLCKKLVEYNRGVDNDINKTYSYYFGIVTW